jgi:methylenetetrahydrofolate reductase (NADPH)
MKVTDIWKSNGKQSISFELYPPRSEKAAQKLENTIDALSDLEPDFVSVTFGAGGSTKEGSHQLLRKLKIEKGLEVVGYFAGYGLGPDEITAVLDSYKDLGIDNILVVRGDIPRESDDFQPHPDSFRYASELLEFIRPKYDFCIGVAAYPEGHLEAISVEKDLEYLQLKVANGADYIITNYTYDNQYFFDFSARCQKKGITVPIIPGVMPIYSPKMMESLANLCGASIPNPVRRGLAALPEGDKEAVLNYGMEFAFQQCKGLLSAGAPGVHIYTMDRSKSVSEIVMRLRNDEVILST